MGSLGHFSVGLAAKPAVPKVSLGVLLLASWILDIFAIAFGFTAIERAEIGNPWSHGLFMSVVWSMAFGLLAKRIYRDCRAGSRLELWSSAIGCSTSFRIPSLSPAFPGIRGSGATDIPCHVISHFCSAIRRESASASTTRSARLRPPY